MTTTQTDRLASVSSLGIKAPCRVATTANITLSGLQTIGGITVIDGDRVLVKSQTNAVENGIYLAKDSTWQRARDFDGAWDSAKGTLIRVNEGTGAGLYYQIANAVIGTDSVTFAAQTATVMVDSFGAVGDGVTDDSAAFASAVATGLTIEGSYGKSYLITTSALNVTDRSLMFEGNGCTLVDGYNGSLIYANIQFTELQSISAFAVSTYDFDNASSTATTVSRLTVSDASKYAVGDRVKVMSDDLNVGINPSQNERMGEFATVGAVDTGNNYVYLSSTLIDSHSLYATTPKIAKMPKGFKFRAVNFRYRTSDAKDAQATWVHAAIRADGFGYGDVEFDGVCERSNALFFMPTSCVGIVKDKIIVEASHCRTDAANGAYGYGLLINSCHDVHAIVHGDDCRHVGTTGTGAVTSGDWSNDAIKSRGRTSFCTIEGGGINCQSAALDLHPDARYCTLILDAVTQGRRGNSGGHIAATLRGIANKLIYKGHSVGGIGCQVIADYDHPDNSRDHEIINASIVIDSNYNDYERYPFKVLGLADGNCRGIKLTNPRFIRKGGGTTMPDVYCSYGEVDVYNPQHIFDGYVISTNNSHLYEADVGGTIRRHGGVADLRFAASGSGMHIDRVADAAGKIEALDPLVVKQGASGVVKAWVDMRSVAGVYYANFKTDYVPTNTPAISNAAGTYSFHHEGIEPNQIVDYGYLSYSWGGPSARAIDLSARLAKIIRVQANVSVAGNTITSITAGNVYGQELVINNIGTQSIDLVTGAGNILTGTNITIAANKATRLYWEGVYWRPAS